MAVLPYRKAKVWLVSHTGVVWNEGTAPGAGVDGVELGFHPSPRLRTAGLTRWFDERKAKTRPEAGFHLQLKRKNRGECRGLTRLRSMNYGEARPVAAATGEEEM